MDKETWLGVKRQQIELYRNRAAFHKKKRATLALIYVIGGILAVILPWVMFMEGNFLIALGSLILIPVSILVWKISTHENRSAQLLLQLADAVEKAIKSGNSLGSLKNTTTKIETRFLSNDDELFVKKAIWRDFMNWKRLKRDEEISYERAYARYKSSFILPALRPPSVWRIPMIFRSGLNILSKFFETFFLA